MAKEQDWADTAAYRIVDQWQMTEADPDTMEIDLAEALRDAYKAGERHAEQIRQST